MTDRAVMPRPTQRPDLRTDQRGSRQQRRRRDPGDLRGLLLRSPIPLSRTATQRLVKVIAGYRAAPTATADPAEARRLDSLIERTTCPTGRVSPLSRQGIVPIGTPVLHRATEPVTVISTGLARFGLHMVSAMRRANGIGLAANQVGVPVRVLAHNLGRVLPQIMVNPEATRSQGRWTYGEGCLSLRIEGTAVDVVRPRVITVVATLLDGRVIAVRADELLARVLQHEAGPPRRDRVRTAARRRGTGGGLRADRAERWRPVVPPAASLRPLNRGIRQLVVFAAGGRGRTTRVDSHTPSTSGATAEATDWGRGRSGPGTAGGP